MTGTIATILISPSSSRIVTSDRGSTGRGPQTDGASGEGPLPGDAHGPGSSFLGTSSEGTREYFWGAAASTASVAEPESILIPTEILDGGEIVLLAIKPSLWFVILDSARWLVGGVMLLVYAALPAVSLGGLSARNVAQLAGLMMAARLGVGLLRWVSRYYVLTNRRVMRLRGVLRPDLIACPLLDLRHTQVRRAPHERVLSLGTIDFATGQTDGDELSWRNIARCDEVHEIIRRAVKRAIDSQPHG